MAALYTENREKVNIPIEQAKPIFEISNSGVVSNNMASDISDYSSPDVCFSSRYPLNNITTQIEFNIKELEFNEKNLILPLAPLGFSWM